MIELKNRNEESNVNLMYMNRSKISVQPKKELPPEELCREDKTEQPKRKENKGCLSFFMHKVILLMGSIFTGILLLFLHPVIIYILNIIEKAHQIIVPHQKFECYVLIKENSTFYQDTNLTCEGQISDPKYQFPLNVISLVILSLALLVIVVNSICFPLCKYNVSSYLHKRSRESEVRIKILNSLLKKRSKRAYQVYLRSIKRENEISKKENDLLRAFLKKSEKDNTIS